MTFTWMTGYICSSKLKTMQQQEQRDIVYMLLSQVLVRTRKGRSLYRRHVFRTLLPAPVVLRINDGDREKLRIRRRRWMDKLEGVRIKRKC